MTFMDFGEALKALRAGKRVCRNGWNGSDFWLELQVPDEDSKMTRPYIYINYPEISKSAPGLRIPWSASQMDMLADDWNVV